MIQSLKPLPINFTGKFIHNSIQWSGHSPQMYIPPYLGNFLVYSIQISETPPLA